MSNGDASLLGEGNFVQCAVGQEPMHDRQPTHAASTTTTGRFGWFVPDFLSRQQGFEGHGMHRPQLSRPNR